MSCEHPKNQQYAYLDDTTVCNACGCVIAQDGKPIQPYSPTPTLDDFSHLRAELAKARAEVERLVVALEAPNPDSELLDRVRGECEIDYPARFDHDHPGDPTTLEVSGPANTLRALAERITK